MSIKYLSILGLSALSLVFAAQANALTAKQTVEKEVVTISADGTKVTTRLPAEIVVPGETVVYTVEFINDSEAAATDLVLAMPIPFDVRFLEGSADRAGAEVLFSADGGETYVVREAVEVPAVGGGTRTARSEDITHVQWTITGPVPVGGTDSVAFKGRLK